MCVRLPSQMPEWDHYSKILDIVLFRPPNDANQPARQRPRYGARTREERSVICAPTDRGSCHRAGVVKFTHWDGGRRHGDGENQRALSVGDILLFHSEVGLCNPGVDSTAAVTWFIDKGMPTSCLRFFEHVSSQYESRGLRLCVWVDFGPFRLSTSLHVS